MMRMPFCGPRRPPWWPTNEPWPPRMRTWRGGPMWMMPIVAFICCVFMPILAWGLMRALWHAGPGALLAPVLVVIPFVLIVLLFTRHVIPIGRIMDGLGRVAAGDYRTRVAEFGPPSVRRLAHAFNTMAARLQDHDRLRRDMMADVAHELRTPLTVMQGTLEGMIDGVYPSDATRVQQLLEETKVLARLVDDLRTLGQSESGALTLEKERLDLSALARDVAAGFAAEAALHRVTMTVDGDASLDVDGDPVRLRQVIANLVSNALRATPADGRVTIVVVRNAADARLSVSDTGRGMSPEELAHVFDRFYKGADSHGSGLGLTIARNIVSLHGGEMRAASEIGRGTTVSFTLPRPA